MKRLNLGVTLGHGILPSEAVAGARTVEAAGFDSLWISESTGFDALSILGAISAQTKRITLATGIVNVYSRSTSQLAMAAATIDELSGGRFILGLGASSKGVVSDWHRLEFREQLSKVKKSVQEIRARLASSLSILNDGRKDRNIPLVIGAVQSKMVILAKEVSDGILFFLRPLTQLKKDAQILGSADFAVRSSVVSCISSDSRAAAERVRRTVAFYVTYGASYRKFLESSGILQNEEVVRIGRLWLKGKREDASKLLPESALEEITLHGTPQDVRRKIESDYASINGLTEVCLQFNQGEQSLSESFKLLGSVAS